MGFRGVWRHGGLLSEGRPFCIMTWILYGLLWYSAGGFSQCQAYVHHVLSVQCQCPMCSPGWSL
jgi:hypothetical protein